MVSAVRPSVTASAARLEVAGAGRAGLRGRLVEHDDERVGEQDPGQRELLGLGGGEGARALADDGVEALGQRPGPTGRAPVTAERRSRRRVVRRRGVARVRLSRTRAREDVHLLGDQARGTRAVAARAGARRPRGSLPRVGRAGRRRRRPAWSCRRPRHRPRRPARPGARSRSTSTQHRAARDVLVVQAAHASAPACAGRRAPWRGAGAAAAPARPAGSATRRPTAPRRRAPSSGADRVEQPVEEQRGRGHRADRRLVGADQQEAGDEQQQQPDQLGAVVAAEEAGQQPEDVDRDLRRPPRRRASTRSCWALARDRRRAACGWRGRRSAAPRRARRSPPARGGSTAPSAGGTTAARARRTATAPSPASPRRQSRAKSPTAVNATAVTELTSSGTTSVSDSARPPHVVADPGQQVARAGRLELGVRRGGAARSSDLLAQVGQGRLGRPRASRRWRASWRRRRPRGGQRGPRRRPGDRRQRRPRAVDDVDDPAQHPRRRPGRRAPATSEHGQRGQREAARVSSGQAASRAAALGRVATGRRRLTAAPPRGTPRRRRGRRACRRRRPRVRPGRARRRSARASRAGLLVRTTVGHARRPARRAQRPRRSRCSVTRVDGGGRVVQHEHRRVGGQGAGQGERAGAGRRRGCVRPGRRARRARPAASRRRRRRPRRPAPASRRRRRRGRRAGRCSSAACPRRGRRGGRTTSSRRRDLVRRSSVSGTPRRHGPARPVGLAPQERPSARRRRTGPRRPRRRPTRGHVEGRSAERPDATPSRSGEPVATSVRAHRSAPAAAREAARRSGAAEARDSRDLGDHERDQPHRLGDELGQADDRDQLRRCPGRRRGPGCRRPARPAARKTPLSAVVTPNSSPSQRAAATLARAAWRLRTR